MKTEFTDVSATQKTITIEIPVDIVDAEINRVAKGYTKQARIPGPTSNQLSYGSPTIRSTAVVASRIP